MNDREFYLQRLQAEGPLFQRVLNALPAGRLDYTPHEDSPTAAEIMSTLAAEHRVCCDLLETGAGEWRKPTPGSYEEMRGQFEASWATLQERAGALDEAGWTKLGRFSSGGKEFPGQPVGQFLWFILFDAIHHRGQLTTYIRPMGGTVPGVYGPSKDDAKKKA